MDNTRETLTAAPDVIYRDIGGEAVLLNLKTGKYYGLNAVGLRIWQLVLENGDLEEVARVMLDEFDVSFDQLQFDINRLVSSLEENGLLVRQKAG